MDEKYNKESELKTNEIVLESLDNNHYIYDELTSCIHWNGCIAWKVCPGCGEACKKICSPNQCESCKSDYLKNKRNIKENDN